MPRRVVYISYDGLSDPLGQSQVLPYVRGLANRGHTFDLISFEKPGAPLAFRERLGENVRWTALRYHQTPTVPATAFDMTQGIATAALTAALARADLLHVRSYVPATFTLPLAMAARVPLVFDTRGAWPEEKVESGIWRREGRLYSNAKAVERVLFRRADAITVLTNEFGRYLRGDYPYASEIRAPIHVIPTCVDLDLFAPNTAPDDELAKHLAGTKPLVYAGSLGGFYMAEDMARFYLEWRRVASPARFLVVTRHDASVIRRVLADSGVQDELVVRSATREQVPRMLRAAIAAVGFDARGFAGVGTAPTKLGEALACGLPMAVTPVGDVPNVVAGTRAAVLVRDTTAEGLARAARDLAIAAADRDISRVARRHAERWFSLDRAVDAYDRLYADVRIGSRGRDTSWPREAD